MLPTPACQFTHLTCLQRQDIQAEMAQQIVIEEQLEFILRDAVMKSCMDDDTVRCIGNAKAAFLDEPLRSVLRNEEYMRKSDFTVFVDQNSVRNSFLSLATDQL